MLTSIQIIDVLKNWNLWGGINLAENSVPRFCLKELIRFVPERQILALIGIRRAGKSTLMFQLMEELVRSGSEERNLLYVNFEEPLFTQYLSLDMLDAILEAFTEIVRPSGRIVLFLDEIQNVPSWERWVRVRTDQGLKVIVSGSSSKLLSSELATSLTGRQISFHIHPFSFCEFISSQGVGATNLLESIKQKARIGALLHDYLRWGGFPEAVLMDDRHKKRVLLSQYFEDILYKDVAFRHGLKDINLLKKLSVYALTNMCNKLSYSRLAGEMALPSVETVRNYFSFLQEAFLLYEIPKFSFKYREQIKTPRKMYAADLGMRNAVAFRFSRDIGRLAENFVFLELERLGYEIFYFQKKQEVDFCARKEGEGVKLINVAWDMSDASTRKREISGLESAMAAFHINSALLLTERLEEEIEVPEGKIAIKPLWLWAVEAGFK
ncbi:MAG: ATP-binding protein [Deltaproteobacteria bacterium]|nr:ATP-binding protein [Deltaproteobacteria bacterium]